MTDRDDIEGERLARNYRDAVNRPFAPLPADFPLTAPPVPDLDVIRRIEAAVKRPRRHVGFCENTEGGSGCFRPSCGCWCHRDPDDTDAVVARSDLTALLQQLCDARAVIAVVEALHVDDETGYCRHCEWQWPCSTIAVINQ